LSSEPLDPPPAQGDAASVQAANRAFYDAFERRDLDAMSDLWERSDRALCTHPGWAPLRGWQAVAASWFALFHEAAPTQFILTEERVEVAGDTAWVTLDENIIGAQVGATVSAVNVFVRGADGWRIVVHHGSNVMTARAPGRGGEQGFGDDLD
jgi:ketosteroid isomerase-like protein